MKKVKILIFMFAVLASSCTSLTSNLTPPPALSESECLPPLFNVAYPIVSPESYDRPTNIPLQGNWAVQEMLPFKFYRGQILIRQAQNEIWIPYGDKVYRYSMADKTWKSYQLTDLANFKSLDGDIIKAAFVANDSTLWGSIDSVYILGDENYPLLVRFNDSMDQFELVPDKGGLLNLPRVHGIRTNIAEDQSGRLWFFADNHDYTADVLYSFDVNTREAQAHYSYDYFTGSSSHLAIGPDGNVWFIEVFKHRLVRYDPVTGDIRFYVGYSETGLEPPGSSFLFDVSKVVNLYFDRSGNLWLDGYGWLDFSNENAPVWNQVITSPAFVFEFPHEENGKYHVVYPQNPYQSSDGRYWFSDSRGITRLDLQREEWCLITRGEGSNVVEDINHNLWMIADSNLYKLPLGE